jgi:hypothetical protein
VSQPLTEPLQRAHLRHTGLSHDRSIPPRSTLLTFPLKALLAVSLVSLAMLFGGTSRAAAATPCWKTLLNDWYDGRIDGTYQIHCYTDALKHLPSDVNTYSSARDDILRALQSARTREVKSGVVVGPHTLVKPPKQTAKEIKAADARRQKGLQRLADQLNPSSPSSLPVPLLVLGGLALLLVAAGGAGLLVKRWQSRRPGT